MPIRARLKWFNAAKGFGFVVPECWPGDAFFHVTQLQKLGVHSLGVGAVISCRIHDSGRGWIVTDICEIIDCGDLSPDLIAVVDGFEISFACKGVVKWYEPDKGFGFVAPDDGMKDVFIHKTCLERHGITEIHAGQRVRLTFKTLKKGREALSIGIEDTP